MKKWEIAATLALTIGLGAGCATPQPEGEDAAARANDSAPQTGEAFASAARAAFNDVNNDFEQLVTDNARLDRERAEAWLETREEILEIRQGLETDLDRLDDVPRDDADDIRSRITENVAEMTHRVERAKLESVDAGRDFVSAAGQRLEEVEIGIDSIESEAERLPSDDREEASEMVEELRQQANDVQEVMRSIAEAAPEDIEEQRDELVEDVATLSAAVQREGLALQAELDN